MAIILLIAIGALVLVAVGATLLQIPRDGYHPVPTRRDLLRLP